MNILDLSPNTFRNLQLFNRQKCTSGLTQVEMLVTLILLAILLTIALSVYHRLMAWIRLNIATFEISQQWKNTRYQATGEGSHPLSLCMAENEINDKCSNFKYVCIAGDTNARTGSMKNLYVLTHTLTTCLILTKKFNNNLINVLSWKIFQFHSQGFP